MNKLNSLPTIYPQELAQKGREIYEKINDKLEKKSFGKYVAIEVESGKYFVGDTQQEALEKAKSHFPTQIFYFVRVGFPGVISLSRHHRPSFYGSLF